MFADWRFMPRPLRTEGHGDGPETNGLGGGWGVGLDFSGDAGDGSGDSCSMGCGRGWEVCFMATRVAGADHVPQLRVFVEELLLFGGPHAG